jgi:putative DNA primase/helicase
MLFEDQWGDVLVTSFLRDPSDPNAPRQDWNAWPARDVLNNPHFDEGNTYFCPSLLVPGTRDRQLDNFRSLNVIVIDDVGTKVDLAEVTSLLRTGPTYLIETSPGNHQAGWKLNPAETDLAWVKGMLHQLDQALGGKADNLTNPVAWRRLPVGWNTKAALGPNGWRVRNKGHRPDRSVRGVDDWLDIEGEIGTIARMTTLNRGGTGNSQRPDATVLAADPVYQAIEAAGMILGEKITSDKFWAVTVPCPFLANHGPTRPLTGCEYVPAVPGHRGWFHCFHCERRTQIEFREQLDVSLREAGAKIVAAFEFDDMDPAFMAAGKTSVGRDLAAYEATEDGLTQAFADGHEGRLRFDHARVRWFRWTGTFWREDETQHAFRWARDLARAFRGSLQDAGPAQIRTIGKIAVAAAIERAARADVRLAVDGLGWDQDPWLVGAPGCEINLRTGETLSPDPAHAITKQLLVAPSDMATPLWDQFLWDSTGGDVEMIRFLQAWAGYGLTGDTSEEKFVFIYGPGGNGKGTYLYTVSAILMDYAARTPADMFMVRKYDPHSEEVARLAGVRSITATEIEEGRTFNVVRLKDFTGRDGRLVGAFKHRNTFEFMPQFKVTFVGNNQPRLTNVDDAIRRRVVLLPFTQTPQQVDITLKDQLVREYPGILRWMIQGENLRRAMGGLTALVPAVATRATSAYLDEQDTLKAWAGERCVFGPQDQMGVTSAFEDYRSWCVSQGEQTMIGIQEFSRKFLETFPSCQKNRRKQGQVLEGSSLSPQDDGRV